MLEGREEKKEKGDVMYDKATCVGRSNDGRTRQRKGGKGGVADNISDDEGRRRR